jgi:hypothetical protein
MIYEFRTYTLKPRSLAEVEKRYGEAYEYRKKYSPLAAFWHTEVGPLNEIIHVWGYTDLAERARIRAEAAKDANWPPKIREFVIDQDVEVVTPFPFIPDIKPDTVGPIFEIRRYSLTAGSLPAVRKRWEGIGERTKRLAGGDSRRRGVRRANRFIHIWAYKAWTSGWRSGSRRARPAVCPPPGGGDEKAAGADQQDRHAPSPFSPAAASMAP